MQLFLLELKRTFYIVQAQKLISVKLVAVVEEQHCKLALARAARTCGRGVDYLPASAADADDAALTAGAATAAAAAVT